MPDVEAIRTMLVECGQGHLLRFYDQVSDAQRAGLIKQIESIDFQKLGELIEKYVLRKPDVEIPAEIQPVEMLPARPRDEDERRRYADARRLGAELIAAGKVAAFVVAGGQGTRLGCEGPKGCLEATPVTKKPLFQLFAEQILAASRRGGVSVPWYVMTSPANDVATRAFFRQHEYFGLPQEDVFFFEQGTMSAIGFDGKLILADTGSLALSPDGHGGSLTAMRRSGALDDMAQRGVELISYFQVDNPLVRCLDPLMLGLHVSEDAQVSAKCLPKRDPMEKLGNLCVVDGRVRVIEYSDLPDELATATTEDGRLKFSAGSIAIHVFSRAFVEELTADGGANLPYHRAEKEVAWTNDVGEIIQPTEPNAVKLEMFVFDAMPLARKVVVLETERDEEFSPIKNASGDDTLASSLRDQVRRAAAWLEAHDIPVPRDADGQIAAAIEISPLLANGAEELAGKVPPDLRITPGQSVYLDA